MHVTVLSIPFRLNDRTGRVWMLPACVCVFIDLNGHFTSFRLYTQHTPGSKPSFALSNTNIPKMPNLKAFESPHRWRSMYLHMPRYAQIHPPTCFVDDCSFDYVFFCFSFQMKIFFCFKIENELKYNFFSSSFLFQVRSVASCKWVNVCEIGYS